MQVLEYVYYIGNDKKELTKVSLGEKLKVIKGVEAYCDPHPDAIAIKTIDGNVAVLHRSNVSSSPFAIAQESKTSLKDWPSDFKIGDDIYYIGETIPGSLSYGNKYFVVAMNYDNTVVVSESRAQKTFVAQLYELSKTPPAKEKSSSELLNEIRAGIDDRLKAAGGDKDVIKRLCHGVIVAAPNPTAIILRQIADNLDAGLSAIVNSTYSAIINEDGTRTSFTIEIVDGAGGDRD